MRPVFARLQVPEHRLPLPDSPGSFFPAEGRIVDADDLFFMSCLADGSLVEAPAPAASTHEEV